MSMFESHLRETNERLKSYEFGSISFSAKGDGLICFDDSDQYKLLAIVNRLLDTLEARDTSNCTPSYHGNRGGFPSSEDVIAKLKIQVTRLQYENTRLRVELVNRPGTEDLRTCQERVATLEEELSEYRRNVKRNVCDLVSMQGTLEDVAVLLKVDSIDSIIPEVIALQLQSQKIDNIQQDMYSVLETMLGGSHRNEDMFSPRVWQNVLRVAKDTRHTLTGAKDLRNVLEKVYRSLHHGSSEWEGRHYIHQDHNRVGEDMNCKEMARLIRSWLKDRKNLKSAQYGSLMDIVRHFQKLFDVSSLSGIYSAMNTLYCGIHEARGARNNLSEVLGIESCRSWESIVSTVHRLASQTHSRKLLLSIHSKYPDLNDFEILEQLKVSQKFCPAFYKMVKELQDLLDVQSLGAIVPAVRRMKLMAV